jgi:hypothetical protein
LSAHALVRPDLGIGEGPKPPFIKSIQIKLYTGGNPMTRKQKSSMKPFMNTDTPDDLAPNLMGAVIRCIRRMTEAELAANSNYWYSDAGVVVLELTDGTLLYPSQDEEGNGPGALFGETPDGRPFRLYVEEKEAPGG